jgi:CelD/BcsL family acetyltransferase involved in cellulose biosynthesis
VEPRLEVAPLEDVMADTEILAAWRYLAATEPGASYFQTPDWVVSWWETVGGQPSGSVALAWEGLQLVGVIALARTRERLTGRIPLQLAVVSNAGSGIGTDHSGWLARDGAVEALKEWLTGAGPMLLKGIPLDMGEALGGRLLEKQRCPRLAVSDLANVMSTKLAKTLRNARKRLANEGVGFKWIEPGEVKIAHLESLYDLNERRRAETGDQPVFGDPARRAFHERLLRWADEKGGTAVVIATRGEEVVGVLYGFSWQRTFAYYQIGWDPKYRQLSLGSVMVWEAIEECANRDIEVFDFLRGAEEYKYRFGATDEVEGTFAVGNSTALTAIGAANRLRKRRRSVKR